MPKKPKTDLSAQKSVDSGNSPELDSSHEFDTPETWAAKKLYVSGLVARGEAVPESEDGTTPSNVTHTIVEQKPGEIPIVKRNKFTLK